MKNCRVEGRLVDQSLVGGRQSFAKLKRTMQSLATSQRRMNQETNPRTRTDLLLLAAFCGFLFFYGLGAFGLLGADEPRYAQVAREMLDRSDWITPTLQGKPWLEKPVLYYWQAMLAFRAAGVSDKDARVPAAFDAAMLIAAIYFFSAGFVLAVNSMGR